MSLSKKYKLSEVIEFGEQLVQTGDLDPCYIALFGAKLPQRQLERLLLAYFLFYHLGAAAALSEYTGENFWDLVENAAVNEMPPNMHGDWPGDRWPRGTERRHFRGVKCVAAVRQLREYPPEYFVQTLTMASRGEDLVTVMGWVQQRPMFGPWVAFKVADILERVLGVPITFPNDLTLFYKEPRKALDMLEFPAEKANAKLLKHFTKFLAPPDFKRACSIQEVETCLCKAKSGWGGHYWIGKDIHEVRNALRGWGKTADKLYACMPREVERGLFR